MTASETDTYHGNFFLPDCSISEGDSTCDDPVIEGRDRCVLHLIDDDKNIEEFSSAFQRRIQSGSGKFHQIYAPKGFRFPRGETFSVSDPHGWISFHESTFNGNVELYNVSFESDTYFSNVKFLAGVKFRLATFNEGADFGGARFKGPVDFTGATFRGKADFLGAQFYDTSDFRGMTFTHKVSFGSAVFNKRTNLTDCTFAEESSFHATTFTGQTFFTNSTFLGRVDFQYTQFLSDEVAMLHRCTFKGPAVFSEMGPVKRLDAQGSTFLSTAIFHRMIVTGVARFNGCTFSGNVLADNMRISGYFSIASGTIAGNLSLDGIKGERRSFLELNGTSVKGSMSFSDSTVQSFRMWRGSIEGATYIIGNTIAEEFSLKGSKLKGEFRLNNGQYGQVFEMEDVELTSNLTLHSINFGARAIWAHTNLEKVVFRGIYLGNCLFANAVNIEKAEFDNVQWAYCNDVSVSSLFLLYEAWAMSRCMRWDRFREEESFPNRWVRLAVADEIRARTKQLGPVETEKTALRSAERVYRAIRASYEARKDFQRASDFYYAEMETRRLASLATPYESDHDMLAFLYRLASGYGERWLRATIWFLGLWILCSFLYLGTGLLVKVPEENQERGLITRSVGIGSAADPHCRDVLCYMSGLPDSLLHSFLVATFIGRDVHATPANKWGHWLQTAESILGPLFVAFMVLAVRRRFQR